MQLTGICRICVKPKLNAGVLFQLAFFVFSLYKMYLLTSYHCVSLENHQLYIYIYNVCYKIITELIVI